jgi:tRNA dimethylallyltransferase
MKRLEREKIKVLHDELSIYDRKSASKIHPRDTARVVRALEVFLSTGIPLSVHQQHQAPPAARFKKLLTIGLTCARTDLYDRINQRTVSMVEEGLEGEVRSLLKKGYPPDLKSMQSIGYRHMVQYLSGIWSRDELIETLARDTRRYAKRQYTWFNKDKSIVWFNRSEVKQVLLFTESWLNRD